MASSTIRPVANTSASKVRILIEKPSAQISAKEPINATGIANAGTSVARHEPINTHSVITTSSTVSNSELMTSSTELLINCASSEVKVNSISGKRTRIRSIKVSTSSEISMVLDCA